MRLSLLFVSACAPIALLSATGARAEDDAQAAPSATISPATMPAPLAVAQPAAPSLVGPSLVGPVDHSPALTAPLLVAASPATAAGFDASETGNARLLPDVAFDDSMAGVAAIGGTDDISRYGPVDPARSLARYDYTSDTGPRMANGHIPREYSQFGSFGAQFHQIRWEALAGLAFYTGINSVKFWQNPTWFHFHDEGFFGSHTISLGMDKLVHAYDTYLISEILHHRLHRKTGGVEGDVVTTALIASGLMIYSELYDGIERTAGISMQDVLFNTMGAGFSVLRHSVPNLENILDFRVMIVPNNDIYTRTGKEHYRQQRFLLAFQLSGFPQFRNSPLRFLELHLGYYATGFTDRERARGDRPQQRPFFGIGLNVGQLLFGQSRSTIGSAARSVLDYVQIPYTAAHMDITGHITY